MGAASIPRFCLTRCAAIVIGALLAQLATAADNIRFNRFGVDQGLSQARVQAIAQDQSGFIWLGTQQGLNRFCLYLIVGNKIKEAGLPPIFKKCFDL